MEMSAVKVHTHILGTLYVCICIYSYSKIQEKNKTTILYSLKFLFLPTNVFRVFPKSLQVPSQQPIPILLLVPHDPRLSSCCTLWSARFCYHEPPCCNPESSLRSEGFFLFSKGICSLCIVSHRCPQVVTAKLTRKLSEVGACVLPAWATRQHPGISTMFPGEEKQMKPQGHCLLLENRWAE